MHLISIHSTAIKSTYFDSLFYFSYIENNANNNNASKNDTNDDSGDNKIELESTEKSDVLNEINKVNKWLRDNKNHHKSSAMVGKGGPVVQLSHGDPTEKTNKYKRITKLPSITISEDEDNSVYTGGYTESSSVSNVTSGKNAYNAASRFGKEGSSVSGSKKGNIYDEEANANSSASNEASNKTKSFETTDSAIDIRSYGLVLLLISS